MTMLYRCALGLLALALAACGDGDDVPLRPDAATDVEVVAMRASPNRALDLLVVMDNTIGMVEVQTAIKDAFPDLLHIIDTVDGGRPDLHIGVTSTDLGATGSLAPDTPGTGIPGTQGGCQGLGDDGRFNAGPTIQGAFIADIAGVNNTRTVNFTGTLEEAFDYSISLGGSGCGFEQPFRALERALQHPNNAGFLRPDANFAALIVTDEDDCSLRDARLLSAPVEELGPLQSFRCTTEGLRCNEDIATEGAKTGCHAREDSAYVEGIQRFIDLLRGLKPDPRMVTALAIIGPPDPIVVEPWTPPMSTSPVPALLHTCNSAATGAIDSADPGLRIAELVDGLHSPQSLALSLCTSDLHAQLTAIGRSLKKLVGDPCIDTASLADTSPTGPGIQPHCTAYDDIAGTRVVIPACADAFSTDCFELVTDEVACPYVADHLRVHVRRSFAPSAETWTYVRCAI